MKMRGLPPIDLARVAPSTTATKWSMLKSHKNGAGPFSYDPVRRRESDLLRSQMPLFDETPDVSWEKLAADIWRECRGDQSSYNSNTEVGKLTYDFVREGDAHSVHYPLPSFDIGFGGLTVSYWAKSVLILNEKAHIVFFDHRRTRGLSKLARKFIFSLMHEHIRAQQPDLSNAELGIFQFPAKKREKRRVQLYTAGETELFTYSELQEMISETYNIWISILSEREEKKRRGGGGT